MMKNWHILTMKGLLALGFGTAILWAPLTLNFQLIRIFGIILLLSGITLIITSVVQNIRNDRSWNLTEGFLDIVIATVLLAFQGMNTDIFIVMIGIWISFIGILQISNRHRLLSLFNHWGFLFLNGLLAILFAVFLFTFPSLGVITRGVLIGLQAGILIGFLMVSTYHIKRLLEDIHIDIPQKEGEDGNQELSYY
jgi:uncharacterized membrane protein HdeD (DUF308 family)